MCFALLLTFGQFQWLTRHPVTPFPQFNLIERQSISGNYHQIHAVILQKDFSDKAQAEIYTFSASYVDLNKKITSVLHLEFIVTCIWTLHNAKQLHFLEESCHWNTTCASAGQECKYSFYIYNLEHRLFVTALGILFMLFRKTNKRLTDSCNKYSQYCSRDIGKNYLVGYRAFIYGN